MMYYNSSKYMNFCFRHFNEIAKHQEASAGSHNVRPRTVSSPIPYNCNSGAPRSISPSKFNKNSNDNVDHVEK